jgi:hypothetical protein
MSANEEVENHEHRGRLILLIARLLLARIYSANRNIQFQYP